MLSYTGEPERAIGMVQKAMRLNPQYHQEEWYLHVLCRSYALLERYDEAMASCTRIVCCQ